MGSPANVFLMLYLKAMWALPRGIAVKVIMSDALSELNCTDAELSKHVLVVVVVVVVVFLFFVLFYGGRVLGHRCSFLF